MKKHLRWFFNFINDIINHTPWCSSAFDLKNAAANRFPLGVSILYRSRDPINGLYKNNIRLFNYQINNSLEFFWLTIAIYTAKF